MKQFGSNPSLDACFGRHFSQGCAPPGDAALGNTGDASFDVFAECCTQLAFGINKADQDVGISRIDFVSGIRPH
jgi:hypothetical protein